MQNAELDGKMKENIILEKSFDFSVRCVNARKFLSERKNEYIMSKQLMRCGTSVGANVAEAQRGQSTADFAAKMAIALKEAYEAEFWIRLLYRTTYFNQKMYDSMEQDVQELISILTSICKTTNLKK